ncbi:MAG TPA: alpha-glucuronidase family glycosyl hydrolase [Steroidobacteraceae bacterium]|nr:alpha-glucuronidase family glycosyl hydrolase [Steroidobacteraceae bacterium]
MHFLSRRSTGILISVVLPLAALALRISPARAEEGHELWLRYHLLEPPWRDAYRAQVTQLIACPHERRAAAPPGTAAERSLSPTLLAARSELARGLTGLLGTAPERSAHLTRGGALLFGTARACARVAGAPLSRGGLGALGKEGYLIDSIVVRGRRITVIAANTDVGVLHGAFDFLRLLQTQRPIDHLAITSSPRLELRVLDHWDNLDGTVERGYAGGSIWHWGSLPEHLDPRYLEYARACASIGINGTVLNNVNASATILTRPYLTKVAALARVFRPYGLRVYLSARFSAPIEIGGLKTADPLDPAVRAWWRSKVDEIYRLIPDFGGFLVKADSEGQPGPQDYGRTHADGANMMADALAPHGGILMWRAFVYGGLNEDRARQAYDEFVPLDGKFRANVLLQVKNGPIDFQPREPFNPLFGAMRRTPVMMEVQITKEYLGFATHLVYLGPLYEEVLRSDTYAKGRGSTVARVLDGSLFGYGHTGMAGVANIGTDRNWTGSEFNQANWYVFGRLAWDPLLSSRAIAEEWVRMTFSNDPAFVAPVVAMMMSSREAAVDYMTPLGLAHIMARDTHYGPGPWVSGGPRPEWTAVYYHHADSRGIGFDRTASGSNAVAQYAPPVAAQFSSLARVPEKYLLWFHHVPWDYRLASGRTVWDELVVTYTRGVERVREMRRTWSGLKAYVDPERFAEVTAFLAIQEREARWWRDACIAYFQSVSQRPLPAGVPPPQHTLAEYESICYPYVPGSNPKTPACHPARPMPW